MSFLWGPDFFCLHWEPWFISNSLFQCAVAQAVHMILTTPALLPGFIVRHNEKSGPGLSPSTRLTIEANTGSATPCTLPVFSDLPRVLSSLSQFDCQKVDSYTNSFRLSSSQNTLTVSMINFRCVNKVRHISQLFKQTGLLCSPCVINIPWWK